MKHFIAKHKIQDDKWYDFYYYSLSEAIKSNPNFKEWREVL